MSKLMEIFEFTLHIMYYPVVLCGSNLLGECKNTHLLNSVNNFPFADLFDCFSLFLAPDFDSTPCMTVVVLLLQSLQKIPDIAESRSRQLVPLFLKFLGYGADDHLRYLLIYFFIILCRFGYSAFILKVSQLLTVAVLNHTMLMLAK